MLVCTIPVFFTCLAFKAKVLGSTDWKQGSEVLIQAALSLPSLRRIINMPGTPISIFGFISISSKDTDFPFAFYLCLGNESAFMISNFKIYRNFTQDWLLRHPQTNSLSCKIFIFNVSMLGSLFSAKRGLQKSLRENIWRGGGYHSNMMLTEEVPKEPNHVSQPWQMCIGRGIWSLHCARIYWHWPGLNMIKLGLWLSVFEVSYQWALFLHENE